MVNGINGLLRSPQMVTYSEREQKEKKVAGLNDQNAETKTAEMGDTFLGKLMYNKFFLHV